MGADDDRLSIFNVGLKASRQSAPELANPSRVSGPRRAKLWVLNSSVSSGPLNFQLLSVG